MKNWHKILIGMAGLVVLAGVVYFFVVPPQVVENSKKETIVVEKQETAGVTRKEPTLPQINLSTEIAEQADTIVVKVSNADDLTDGFTARLVDTTIDFFKKSDSGDAGNSANWLGLVGIDAKQSPGKYNLIVQFPDGYSVGKKLSVAKRDFPVTGLVVTEELKEKGYSPSQIAENIVEKENKAIKEILDIYTPSPYFSGRFFYPLDNIKDVGAFGNIRKSGDIMLQHLGVDLEADVGASVYAIHNGIVRFTEEMTNYGKTLIIDHGLGIFSLYLHLDEFKASIGSQVKQGDIIALSGNTGYSIAPHLHFAVKLNGASVDPLRFIAATEKEM